MTKAGKTLEALNEMKDDGFVWQVVYKNQGRSEKGPLYDTEAEARKDADFLKAQGATSIRVVKKIN